MMTSDLTIPLESMSVHSRGPCPFSARLSALATQRINRDGAGSGRSFVEFFFFFFLAEVSAAVIS